MWTRAELKSRAKEVLRSTYWKSFLVSLLIAFLGASGGGSGVSTGNDMLENNYHYDTNYIEEYYNYDINIIEDFSDADSGIVNTIAVALGVSALVIVIASIAVRIFLGYPIEVSGRKFFLEAAYEDADLNFIGFAFKKGRYMNIVKTMFFRAIYNFFWYLLFIIPGIVKSYAYSMVPYILAENPNIETDRVIEISKEITRGHKLSMWVLDLSFIGWYILGTLLFIVGTFFVLPYENATKAQLYIELKRNAIEGGIVSAHELSIQKYID